MIYLEKKQIYSRILCIFLKKTKTKQASGFILSSRASKSTEEMKHQAKRYSRSMRVGPNLYIFFSRDSCAKLEEFTMSMTCHSSTESLKPIN